ncbi:MAG: RtcB family protein, partial [Spirochaetia bacterium]
MRPRDIVQVSDHLWEIPRSYRDDMQVPVRIYASGPLFAAMEEGVFEQAVNVASLPGIVGHSFCMPDGHWGYGFPIGGVAAFDTDAGIISPGGIGFDINCGMRLITTSLDYDEIREHIPRLIDTLFERVPASGPERRGSGAPQDTGDRRCGRLYRHGPEAGTPFPK